MNTQDPSIDDSTNNLPPSPTKQSPLQHDKQVQRREGEEAMHMKAIATAIRRYKLCDDATPTNTKQHRTHKMSPVGASSRHQNLLEPHPQWENIHQHKQIVNRLLEGMKSVPSRLPQKNETRHENSQMQQHTLTENPEEVQRTIKNEDQEEIERHGNVNVPNVKTGSVTVPCRARGMPRDHDFKTALFVIPENVGHGEGLVCSHLSCRNAGIKFRFCAYCKIPAARKNFAMRHNHRDEGTKIADNVKDGTTGDLTSTIINIGDRNRGVNFEEDRISSLTTSSNNHSESADDPNSTYSNDKNFSTYQRSQSKGKRIDNVENTKNVWNRKMACKGDQISPNNYPILPHTGPSCLPQIIQSSPGCAISSLSSPENYIRPRDSTHITNKDISSQRDQAKASKRSYGAISPNKVCDIPNFNESQEAEDEKQIHETDPVMMSPPHQYISKNHTKKEKAQILWKDQEEKHKRIVNRLLEGMNSTSSVIQQNHESMQENPQEKKHTLTQNAEEAEQAKIKREEDTLQADDAKNSKMKKGSVIVPCRARGMPKDHDFKTAYFVIPENIGHGEGLACSYSSCRNAGIKFRFCAYCKIPAARKNFAMRHNHRDEGTKIADNVKDGATEGLTSTIIDIGDRNRGVNFEEDRISSLTSSSNNHSDDADDPNSAVESTDSNDKNHSSPSCRRDESKGVMKIDNAENIKNAWDRKMACKGGLNVSPFFSPNNAMYNYSGSLSSASCAISSLSFPSSQNRPQDLANVDKSTSFGCNLPPGTKRSYGAAFSGGDSGDETDEEISDDHESHSNKRAKNWRLLLRKRPATGDRKAISAWLQKVMAVSNRTKFKYDGTSLSEVLAALNTQTKSFVPNKHSQYSNESDTSSCSKSDSGSGGETEDNKINHPISSHIEKFNRQNVDEHCIKMPQTTEKSFKDVNLENNTSPIDCKQMEQNSSFVTKN